MKQTAQQIEATIQALEAQRALLGEAVVESALAPLRRELASLALRPPPPPGGQLRQVSVLFVDVVGSTAMGQQLQPEDIHAVMDTALERFTAVVRSNYGRVLQYTGDGMLAAFGAEEAHEDDVENAIRAGLGVIEEARRHAPEVLHSHGVPDFNVRAGINTGTVLLGAGVDAEGSVRGAVVNVAARMEQSAPAGGLRISHDTYRHVRGVFDVSEQPPIDVKGVAAPVRSYLVNRIRPRSFEMANRGIEGLKTRTVGRDRELGHLEAAFDAVVAGGMLRAVTVLGDAGLGKSRLLNEFKQSLERRGTSFWLLPARAHSRSALHSYDLLRDLITRQLQIEDSDSAAVARDKLVAGLSPLFADEGEAPAHHLGHLIGLDFSASPHLASILNDGQKIRQHAFQAVGQFLRRLAASNAAPVVIILDDLHWGDDGSLDMVIALLQSNHDMALLVLMLARPQLLERRTAWAQGDSRHDHLHLEPLDSSHSMQLAEALLQRLEDVPAALHDLILAGAEGNPLYMEELVKMLIDDGAIATGDDRWRIVPERLAKVRVPPTLNGLLQMRLDGLSQEERRALQSAAVIGQVFSDHALAAIDPSAPAALAALLRKRMIVRRNASGFEGVQEYAFQHNLLQQVAYDAVLKGPRRHGHAKVGGFWSTRAEVQAPLDVNPAACRALVEAHYHRCQSDPMEYVGWFEGQFFNYLNAYAAQTLRPLAESLIEVCERHFGEAHPNTARSLTNLARVILVQGDVEKAEPLLRRAIAIQEIDPGADHADTARTIAVLGGYFSGRGDLRSSETWFRRALAIRQKALGDEHPLTVGTLQYLSHAVAELGRYDEAESLGRRLLEVRERLLGPDHPDTALALREIADVLSKKNAHDEAVPLLRRALAAQQRNLPAGHPDTALSMWNLAEALHGLGRSDESEPLARQALQAWEKALGPEHEWSAWGLGTLAKVRLAQGAAEEAARLAERALRIHETKLGPDHPTLAEHLELLCAALKALGDPGSAEPVLERARALRQLGRDPTAA